MRTVAEQHVAGLDQLARDYLGDRAGLEAIGRDALRERLARGEVVVVDVRPAAEYTAGHIAGARSLPIAELRRRLRELPADRAIVAYCRGPYCVFADDAVRHLREPRLPRGAPGRRIPRVAQRRSAHRRRSRSGLRLSSRWLGPRSGPRSGR